MEVIPLYIGFDPRESIGTHAFIASVLDKASMPVAFTPLHLPGMLQVYRGGQRDGSNAFTYSRFLVPYLQRFQGWAIFADGADMVCRADIAELWALRHDSRAVQVVMHDYKTKHPRKYVGTEMEADNRDYPRKNWSSLMLINCAHKAWRDVRPRFVQLADGSSLHRLTFIDDRDIGALPIEWNWLADEYGENQKAKLLHWTAGIPHFHHYAKSPHAREWDQAKALIE